MPSDKTSLATKDKEDVFSKLDRMYANEWRFSKKTSPIDDSTNLYISKYAVGDKNRKWPNYNHTMFIRCQENELNVYVTLDDRVYGDGGKVDVVYRLDRSPGTTSKWIIGRENRSILYPENKKQVIQFVGNLIKHEKIFIRVSPSKKNHFDVEFNLEYLEECARKFPDDCEIPGTRNDESPRTIIKETQEFLAAEGYDPGPIDGLAGQKTRRAVQKYQIDNGLEVTKDPLDLKTLLSVEEISL